MSILIQVFSKVKSSSEGVYMSAGRQTAVSSAVQLWESKMMQSKAMEDLRKNNNSSNFVLQLPANYRQTDQEVTGTRQEYLIAKSVIQPVKQIVFTLDAPCVELF